MTDDIKELLEELVKWTRVQAFPQVKSMLETTLKEDADKLIYHFSDGRGSREVATEAGVSQKPVLGRWEQWYKMGLMEEIPANRAPRKKRIFDLGDFGIVVPPQKKTESVTPSEQIKKKNPEPSAKGVGEQLQ